ERAARSKRAVSRMLRRASPTVFGSSRPRLDAKPPFVEEPTQLDVGGLRFGHCPQRPSLDPRRSAALVWAGAGWGEGAPRRRSRAATTGQESGSWASSERGRKEC